MVCLDKTPDCGIHISFYDESGWGGEGVKQDQDVRPKVGCHASVFLLEFHTNRLATQPNSNKAWFEEILESRTVDF